MANWCSVEAEIVCFMAVFYTKTESYMIPICLKAVSPITMKKLITSSLNNCFPQTHKQKSSVKYKKTTPYVKIQREFYFMYFCQICHLSGVISHSQ